MSHSGESLFEVEQVHQLGADEAFDLAAHQRNADLHGATRTARRVRSPFRVSGIPAQPDGSPVDIAADLRGGLLVGNRLHCSRRPIRRSLVELRHDPGNRSWRRICVVATVMSARADLQGVQGGVVGARSASRACQYRSSAKARWTWIDGAVVPGGHVE